MNYDYGYDFEMFADEMGGELMDVAFVFAGVLLIFGLIAMVVALVMYIFRGIGLHTMAKRRGIKYAWLAWVPVGNTWLIGCIADQYRYVARGEVKNRRKILLGLAIANLVLWIVSSILSGVSLGAVTDQIMYAGPQAAEGIAAGSSLALNSLISLLTSAVSITSMVFTYISLYDLYTSCDPKNNVLFLVLGIFFGFLTSIFIFANRNKDKGMPPKRKPAPVDAVDAQWQPAAAPGEPWENAEE